MLEKKLVVGRYLTMTIPKTGATSNYGEFISGKAPNYLTVKESTGALTKTSAVVPGLVGSKQHRQFQWLDYIVGGISEAPLGAHDILTGRMSGCWIIVYKKNGVNHVAHVGTADGRDDINAAVKNSWNAYAQQNIGDLIAGFNPLRHWQGVYPQGKDGVSSMLALVTTTLQLYAVFIVEPKTPGTVRISGIQQIPSRPRSELYSIT